jgi:hypothetical protein
MIGLVIAYLLKDNADLLALVDTDNIYPYVANEDTTAPAIIYKVESITPVYDKDEWVNDECVFSVETFCKDYATLQDIASEVRVALELEKGTAHGIDFQQIYLTGQSEEAFIDGYSNKLTFSIVINSY